MARPQLRFVCPNRCPSCGAVSNGIERQRGIDAYVCGTGMDLIEINNEFDELCGFLWARREYLDPFEHVMKPVPDEHYHQSLVAMTAKAKNGLVVDGICFLLSDKCLSFRKHLESSGIPVPAPDNTEEVGVYRIADGSKVQFKVPA